MAGGLGEARVDVCAWAVDTALLHKSDTIPTPSILLVLGSREKAEEESHLPLYRKWSRAQCEENGS